MDPNRTKAFEIRPEIKMSFKMKQKKARTSGQPNLVGSKKKGYKEMPGKDPEFTKEKCKCNFNCSELSNDHKLNLFQDIHTLAGPEQNTYLLGLITVIPVQRRRHGQYESPEESRRQCTVTFMAPDGKGGHVRGMQNLLPFAAGSSPRCLRDQNEQRLGSWEK